MPDWFYRTVSRPLLFALPPATARSFALDFMGRLAGLPFGLGVRMIDFLGHMRPDPRLQTQILGLNLAGPIGLSPHLDPMAQATFAWTRFGFGFIEVGPVTTDDRNTSSALVRRNISNETIWMPSPRSGPTLKGLQRRLETLGPSDPSVFVRIEIRDNQDPTQAVADVIALMTTLQTGTACFSLAFPRSNTTRQWTIENWSAFWQTLDLQRKAHHISQPIVLIVSSEDGEQFPDNWREITLQSRVTGFLVDGRQSVDGGFVYGSPVRASVVTTVRRLRESHGSSPAIIASGGIHQPLDADAVLSAGANLVQVDTGLVFSGPGLVKRINEALLWKQSQNGAGKAAVADSTRTVERSWFWTALMGLGMLIGSILALIISATQVVLPYDEVFCGWTRQQIHEFNPRLLLFMSHDRVTLAGTMVAIGLIYIGLSFCTAFAADNTGQSSPF